MPTLQALRQESMRIGFLRMDTAGDYVSNKSMATNASGATPR